MEDNKKEKTPLRRWRRNSLYVTDMAAQAWCEQELEYGFTHGKKDNRVKKQGRRRHKEKQREISKEEKVKVNTREQRWALKFLNVWIMLEQIRVDGICRELPLIGQGYGVWFVGVADELKWDGHRYVVLSDLKTRKKASIPSGAQTKGSRIQIMLYRYLYEQHRKGLDITAFLAHFRLDGGVVFTEELQYVVTQYLPGVSTLLQICETVNKAFSKAPPMHTRLELRYEQQETKAFLGIKGVHFNKSWLSEHLQSYVEYWQGQREAKNIAKDESWKCSYCVHKKHCKAYQ